MNTPIIPFTKHRDELDAFIYSYRTLNYNLREASDKLCKETYGFDNLEMYHLLKEGNYIPDDFVSFQNIMEAVDLNFNSDDKSKKFQLSQKYQEDPNIIIIDPFKDDNVPDYGLPELEDKYSKYMSLGVNFRRMSDNMSMNIWGVTVYNMYNDMKRKLLIRISDIQKLTDLPTSKVDYYIKDALKEIASTSDPVQLLTRKLDCLTEKTSVTDDIIIQYALLDKIEDRLKHTTDFSEDIPQITPYFSPDEMEDLTNQEIDPYEYIFDKDQKELHENIKQAMKLYEGSSTEENRQNVIKLGWNPSVPYNWNTQAFARQRIIDWFNENKGITFIDVTGFKDEELLEESSKKVKDIVPVHIVLMTHNSMIQKAIKTFTQSKFGHAGISFDNDLNKIYSFNGNDNKGFVIESLSGYKKEKNPKLETITFFVKSNVKKRMEDVVKYYTDHIADTRYDFSNLPNFVLRRQKESDMSAELVCSQFVDMLLKHCNIDFTNKPSNLVAPGDFEKIAEKDPKMYITFSGWIKDFKPKNLAKKVRTLLQNTEDIITVPLKEMVDTYFLERSMIYLKSCQTGVVNQDLILSEIRELLTPTPCIVEAKLLPVRFNQKGDLYIDLPRNLEKEYQESHKLIRSYGTDNIEGIKHELCRLFYINQILEHKIRKVKDGDTRYKEYRDLRARVLNDFSYGFRIIADKDPNFDFQKYYKDSEYYHKTIKIDRHTMKYSGKMISNFLKSQGI